MGTKEKWVARFCKLPKDFTYEETLKLLSAFGYYEHNKGATSGSRVRFKNDDKSLYIDIHKPHPGSIMKQWMLKVIYEHLKTNGFYKIIAMDYLEYKGYKGSVEYSKVDNCLCGKVLGMSKELILYEGHTIDELRTDFEAGIDSYLAACQADGVEPRKPYSGTLNIRISPDVHSQIAMLAQEAGITINGYIRQALEKQLKLAHHG